MKILGRTVYARDGWPLECIVGRSATNFFRLLFLGSVRNTFHPNPIARHAPSVELSEYCGAYQPGANTNVSNMQATIGEYADYHSESWVVRDGKLVWDESMFATPEESERWKQHVADNGSVFGISVSNTQGTQ